MRTVFKCWLIVLPTLAFFATHTLFSQTAVRETPVAAFTFEGTALSAILKLGEQSKVSIGVVCAPHLPMAAEVSIKSERSTVGSIMDRILANLPGYRLQVDGPIIHVLPKARHTPSEKLLQVPVLRFYSPSGAPEAVNVLLRHAAKVSLGLENATAKRGGAIDLAVTWIEHDAPVTLDNTTVQQVLDTALERGNGISGWIVLPFNDYRSATKNDQAWLLAPYVWLVPKSSSICR